MEEQDVEKIIDQTEAKGLDELDLSELELSDLPKLKSRISDRLPKIPIVDLSFNNFDQVPQDIFNLRYIIELSVSGCKLEKFPTEIRRLRRLVDLNLSGNRLQVIPEEIVRFPLWCSVNLSRL